MTEIFITEQPVPVINISSLTDPPTPLVPPVINISTISGQEIPPSAYRHSQGASSTTWEIVHNLNFYPNVTVEDSAGTIIEGEIEYVDQNTVRLTFSLPFTGYAYLS